MEFVETAYFIMTFFITWALFFIFSCFYNLWISNRQYKKKKKKYGELFSFFEHIIFIFIVFNQKKKSVFVIICIFILGNRFNTKWWPYCCQVNLDTTTKENEMERIRTHKHFSHHILKTCILNILFILFSFCYFLWERRS